MLAECRDLLPVYEPSTVSFTVEDFFEDLETTVLYGCLQPGTQAEKDEWQAAVISSFLEALAKLIANVMQPLTELKNKPDWHNGDMFFFSIRIRAFRSISCISV